MLRVITKHHGSAYVLELHGRLVGEWLPVLEQHWRRIVDESPSAEIVIVLSQVEFINRDGEQILMRMAESGVKFVVSGCMNRYVIEKLQMGDGWPGEPRGERASPPPAKLEALASVPAAQAAGVSQLARAFAAELESRHLRAKAAVSPVRSRVQGSVYAMAMSRVIDVNVNTAGRSDAEISAEIKSQLAAAGWDASNVEFRTEGDHHTLQITKDGCGSSAASPGGGECAEINLTLDGKPSLGGGQQ